MVRAVAPWLAGALVLVAFVNGASAYLLLIGSTVIIYAISAVGLNVLMGQAGLVSIGNAALMAIGAYTTAILAPMAFWGAFPMPLLTSVVVGGVVGLLIALPALRLRGIYLALATLALQFFVAFGGDRYQSETGHVSGVPVGTLTVAGHAFVGGERDFVLLIGGLLGITSLIVRALSRHAPGRMWNALRESELAATAIGVDAVRWKLSAFVVSSAIIAASGSLLAYANQVVSADSFTLEFAVTFIVILILGGMGTATGPIVGSIVVVALPYVLTNLTSGLPPTGWASWLNTNIFYINNGLYGLLVLVVLLYLPEGVVPAAGRLARRMTARVRTAGTRSLAPGRVRSDVAVDDPAETGPALLEVRGLNVTYPTGALAVHDLHLRVAPQSIVALLGRNGAGKSSTLRAISGFLPAEQVSVSGVIRLAGQRMQGASPSDSAARGIVLVPERAKVFPTLTVHEHLKLAAAHDVGDVVARPYFARLAERLDQSAGLLSGGERQLLALATASLLRPKLLMVDEFSLGLAPVMIQEVAGVIRGLRDDGLTVLLVEQNAHAAAELADWVYVLDGGELVAEGRPEQLTDRILLSGSAEPLSPAGDR